LVAELNNVECDWLSAQTVNALFKKAVAPLITTSRPPPLLAAYATQRRPHGTKPVDVCTLLCVSDAKVSHDDDCALDVALAANGKPARRWMAIDIEVDGTDGSRKATRRSIGKMRLRGRTVAASLAGCFTRHATIDSKGVISSNVADAHDCPSCAHTWDGLHGVACYKPPARRCSSMREALHDIRISRGYSYLARRFGVFFMSALFSSAIESDLKLAKGAGSPPKVARAILAMSALHAHAESFLSTCLWALGASHMPTLRCIIQANSQTADICDRAVGDALANGFALDPIADAATTTAVRLAWVNRMAASITIDSDPTGDRALAKAKATASHAMRDVVGFDGERADARNKRLEKSFVDRLREAGSIIDRVYDAVGKAALNKTKTIDRSAAEIDQAKPIPRGPDGSPLAGDPTPPESPVAHWPEEAPGCAASGSSLIRCAGATCSNPTRRIVSGCAVIVSCTTGCRVAFHRSCWKACAIPMPRLNDDPPSCPTPDCWGTITLIASARMRDQDHTRHVLWSTKVDANLRADRDALLDEDSDHDDRPLDQTATFEWGSREQAQVSVPHEIETIANGNAYSDGEDDNDNRDDSVHAIDNHLAPTTGGVAYQKPKSLHAAQALTQRKRPRNRASKRQRLRLQQRQREKEMLFGSPLPEPDESQADSGLRGAFDDDSLWPCFFVPDPVPSPPGDDF
jgi:hypothetical protein